MKDIRSLYIVFYLDSFRSRKEIDILFRFWVDWCDIFGLLGTSVVIFDRREVKILFWMFTI